MLHTGGGGSNKRCLLTIFISSHWAPGPGHSSAVNFTRYLATRHWAPVTGQPLPGNFHQALGNQSPGNFHWVKFHWATSHWVTSHQATLTCNFHRATTGQKISLGTEHIVTGHLNQAAVNLLGTDHQIATIGIEHRVANYIKGIPCSHYHVRILNYH